MASPPRGQLQLNRMNSGLQYTLVYSRAAPPHRAAFSIALK